MCPQAKKHAGTPATPGAQGNKEGSYPLPQSLQKEPGPANTLVWELCPLDL